MLTNALVIAHKELVDHVRDTGSLASSVLYTLMGPLVVLLVSFAQPARAASGGPSPLPVMAAVFAFVAAFSGGMSVAMDTMAGERERRSLLPLLLNGVPRLDVVVGKWLAASVFAAASLFINLAAFALVLKASSGPVGGTRPEVLLSTIPALLALAALAAAVELLISAMCHSVKEAQTYLSMVVFAAMGVGFWLGFHPEATPAWWFAAPVAGQFRLLEYAFARNEPLLAPSIVLAVTTMAMLAIVLMTAGRIFERDEAVYGS